MAQVYKTISYADANSRNTRALTAEELQKVNDALANFKTYFIAKHLS